MPSDGLRWRALADDLRRDIATGRYPVNTRLPSIRALKLERGVSDKTILTALAQLREEGLIETLHGSGSWVRRPRPPVEVDVTELAQRVTRIERHLGLD